MDVVTCCFLSNLKSLACVMISLYTTLTNNDTLHLCSRHAGTAHHKGVCLLLAAYPAE